MSESKAAWYLLRRLGLDTSVLESQRPTDSPDDGGEE